MFVNGDYFACCDEEENLLRETWIRKRREENIPDDTFVHFDIPLTKEHEAELLKKVGGISGQSPEARSAERETHLPNLKPGR